MKSIRVETLKKQTVNQPRCLSCEQALIITEANKANQGKPEPVVRAWELREALRKISIEILPGELIVGNRCVGVRSGIVYPRCGLLWIEEELDTLPFREQDAFLVDEADAKAYREQILPYWRGHTLEERIADQVGEINEQIQTVVKVNQQGRAQGHIIPDIEGWIKKGPAKLALEAAAREKEAEEESARIFYESVRIVMEGAVEFLLRYSLLAQRLYEETGQDDYKTVSEICRNLAERPAAGFHEALQSEWFLLCLLHMESNAMSFSLGRMDQYLLPYYRRDVGEGTLAREKALELLKCFYLKCNQIVCMCNHLEAQYFAGFPIGFNMAIGGRDMNGNHLENELTFLMLDAQEDLHLPQPNLSARLCLESSDRYLDACARVLGQGGGMPQFMNDESIIPSLEGCGMSPEDAAGYGVVGCVELSGCGDTLAWSNAAMFNLLKVLELTLNHGRCLLTGRKLGLDLGGLELYGTYEAFEQALEKQMYYFIDRMLTVHLAVDRAHQAILPTPLLSGVIKGCMESGRDVTAGGARYNHSGIQLVQVANLVDSLAALKYLVYEGNLDRSMFMEQLRANWPDEAFRSWVANHCPHYGNDEEHADCLAEKWVRKFKDYLDKRTNARNGNYTVGLYTVSSHVPMGANVGASCDGRRAGEPLADGGVSPRAGCDEKGPTAVLKSVSAIPSRLCANGTLLNMKFSQSMFQRPGNLERFKELLRAFVRLGIHHVQFNVVDRQELLDAQENPKEHRNLIIRVAGYSAYFVELDRDLQNEIISRTECVI
ncbi:formate C-acetyltransferase/glycerol dehydratase family glycyl radical enzyme [Clostridium sp. MCC353]|uniref:glycyl radical protein n=1 Tax=Clostridium sp. MCC353 TaxID=2592646 RepID=UPI00207A4C3D|nr:formate C-acetyltransferase/glycerol dehydratase family glycyl radical enzyme [Clostridium sp. MCC353]